MKKNPISVKDLLEIQKAVGDKLATVKCRWESVTNWSLIDGILSHIPPAFFEIIGVTNATQETLLIRQQETAIVALLSYNNGIEMEYLVSARAEPGLSRKCVITSTIQSTPSNINRVHGGKETDYIEYVLHDSESCKTTFSSVEFDYASVYEAKIKRFLVVEVSEKIDPLPNFYWVSETLLKAALYENALIGTDLRALLAQLLLGCSINLEGAITENPKNQAKPNLDKVALESLQNFVKTDYGFAEIQVNQGAKVDFYRTTASTRESSSWIQPLIQFLDDGLAILPYINELDEIRFAVQLKQEVGINRPIYYPGFHVAPGAKASNHFDVSKTVTVNLEGGRFFESSYQIGLIEGKFYSDSNSWQWITLDELRDLLSKPLTTSVELRMTASLIPSMNTK